MSSRYDEIATRILSEVHGIEPCDDCAGAGIKLYPGGPDRCSSCAGTGVRADVPTDPEPRPPDVPEALVTVARPGWEAVLQ